MLVLKVGFVLKVGLSLGLLWTLRLGLGFRVDTDTANTADAVDAAADVDVDVDATADDADEPDGADTSWYQYLSQITFTKIL